MIPKLFDGVGVNNNYIMGSYIGPLKYCKKCQVKEERNGEYTLELETIVNDPITSRLISQRVIQAKPNPHDPLQYFEVQSTEKSIDGIIKASAKHIRNFAFQFVSKGEQYFSDIVGSYTGTPAQIWNYLFNDGYIINYASAASCPYSFSSDINTAKKITLGLNEPQLLGSILGGKEGSMLDLFHGEYKYNNYNISYLNSRGQNTNYKIKYGKNISTAKQSENCLMAYSHIMPYGVVAVENSIHQYYNLCADLIEISNNECTSKKVYFLDCTDAVRDLKIDPSQSGQQSYVIARAAMTSYARQYAAANDIGKVNVSISVDVRSELDAMKSLALCDTVKVELDTLGITTTGKIVSATYDSLLERWDKLVVGTIPLSLSDIILDKRRYNL